MKLRGQHRTRSTTKMQPHNYEPVALLKTNKLGVLGGNVPKTPGVANERSALLSCNGVNTGRGTGALSKMGGGSIEDIQEGKAARANENTVLRAC